jgi:uncharacterized membrane protein YdjX (TVP38/TMEM64 family)
MQAEPNCQPSQAAIRLKKLLPLVLLVAAGVVAVTLGWHEQLSFKTIGLNCERLRAAAAENLCVSIAAFVSLYTVVVALSLPGATIMTLAGGLIFGWQIGTPASLVGATLGATIVFLVARSSLSSLTTSMLGSRLDKLRQGLQENALCYLLFLRLVPAFPFVVVNLASAVLGVPLRTYVLGTFVGISPATLAYSFAGSGLLNAIEAQNRLYRECLARGTSTPAIDCPYTINPSEFVTKELVLGLVLLGIVALAPVLLKKWRLHNATA